MQQGFGGAAVFLFDPGDGVDAVLAFLPGTGKLAFSGFGASFDTPAELLAVAQPGNVISDGVAISTLTIGLGGWTMLVPPGVGAFSASDIVIA